MHRGNRLHHRKLVYFLIDLESLLQTDPHSNTTTDWALLLTNYLFHWLVLHDDPYPPVTSDLTGSTTEFEFSFVNGSGCNISNDGNDTSGGGGVKTTKSSTFWKKLFKTTDWTTDMKDLQKIIQKRFFDMQTDIRLPATGLRENMSRYLADALVDFPFSSNIQDRNTLVFISSNYSDVLCPSSDSTSNTTLLKELKSLNILVEIVPIAQILMKNTLWWTLQLDNLNVDHSKVENLKHLNLREDLEWMHHQWPCQDSCQSEALEKLSLSGTETTEIHPRPITGTITDIMPEMDSKTMAAKFPNTEQPLSFEGKYLSILNNGDYKVTLHEMKDFILSTGKIEDLKFITDCTPLLPLEDPLLERKSFQLKLILFFALSSSSSPCHSHLTVPILEDLCTSLNMTDALVTLHESIGTTTMKDYSQLLTDLIADGCLQIPLKMKEILYDHAILEELCEKSETSKANDASQKGHFQIGMADMTKGIYWRKRKLNKRLFMPMSPITTNTTTIASERDFKRSKSVCLFPTTTNESVDLELRKAFPSGTKNQLGGNEHENVFLEKKSTHASSLCKSFSFSGGALTIPLSRQSSFRRFGGENSLDKPLLELEPKNKEHLKNKENFNNNFICIPETPTKKLSVLKMGSNSESNMLLEPSHSDSTDLDSDDQHEEIIIMETPKKLIKSKKVLFY